MIDIHTHIIPGIDDGSNSIEETMKMLNEAYLAGFTDIITTSHYIEGSYDFDKNQREELIDALQGAVSRNIRLHNGAEAYILPDLVDLYNEGIIPTLANSRYVLFEFPLNSEVVYGKKVINDLLENNYIPIIAHVERYRFVKKDIKKAFELAEMGALLQCNYGSFIGKYGIDAQKAVIKLLKKDKITFLGTDAHRSGSIYTQIDEIVSRIEKTVGIDKLEDMTVNNPKKILKDEYI